MNSLHSRILTFSPLKVLSLRGSLVYSRGYMQEQETLKTEICLAFDAITLQGLICIFKHNLCSAVIFAY